MKNIKSIFNIRTASFLFSLLLVSVIGYMVRADGVFYNGASGSVNVVNKSTIIKDPNGDQMSVSVAVSLAASGSSAVFTLPDDNTDTTITVGLYNSDGNKIWQIKDVPIASKKPQITDLLFSIDPIKQKDYYTAFPDSNAPGNSVKIFIQGSTSKKLYYESSSFKLFDYAKPFSINTFSPKDIQINNKLVINGSGFDVNNIKGVYLYNVGLDFAIINPTQIEAIIPSVISPGKYTLHIVSKDGLFDVYASEQVRVIDMTITSLSPLAPLKETNITLTGTGFDKTRIKNIFISNLSVPFEVKSNTEIIAKVPKELPNGIHEVYILHVNSEKYLSPDKLSVGNMLIESIDPVDLNKLKNGNTSFFIKGLGFFRGSVKDIYLGDKLMNWDIVNDTKIQVDVPADFPINTYEVSLVSVDGVQMKSPININIKDPVSVTNTTNTNTGSGIGGGISNTLPKPKGGIVPKCNVTGQTSNNGQDFSAACGFNALIELVNNIINFLLIYFATPLAAIILVYAGFIYLSSGGSSEKATKAKHILGNMIVGYIIALAAWLIIKTILSTLGFTGAFDILG